MFVGSNGLSRMASQPEPDKPSDCTYAACAVRLKLFTAFCICHKFVTRPRQLRRRRLRGASVRITWWAVSALLSSSAVLRVRLTISNVICDMWKVLSVFLAIIWLDLPADWPESKSKSVTDRTGATPASSTPQQPARLRLRLRLHFCQVAEKRLQKTSGGSSNNNICLSAKLQLHADWPQLTPSPLTMHFPQLLLLLFLLFVVSVASFHSFVLCLFLCQRSSYNCPSDSCRRAWQAAPALPIPTALPLPYSAAGHCKRLPPPWPTQCAISCNAIWFCRFMARSSCHTPANRPPPIPYPFPPTSQGVYPAPARALWQ